MGEGESVSRTSEGNGAGRRESDGDGRLAEPGCGKGSPGLGGEVGTTEVDRAGLPDRALVMLARGDVAAPSSRR